MSAPKPVVVKPGERFNPFTAAFRANPYRYYRHFRAIEPVHWGLSANTQAEGTWYLFRHAEVMAALKDRRLGREAERVLPPGERHPIPHSARIFSDMYRKWMVFRDPPDHTRLRALVQKAFTARVIDALQPRIEQIAHELLDRMQGSSRMDFIGQFAFPLPVIVIAELLGVPASDRDRFRTWSTAISTANLLRRDSDEASYQDAVRATGALQEYLGGIIEARRRRPRADLISGLISAVDEGSTLSYEEMIATSILILTAGHETTVNLLGKGMLALLRNPAQLEWLRKHPAAMPNAVLELLRYDSPVQIITRYAMDDIEYGGKHIPRGQTLGLALASANRDPEAFVDAETLDLSRDVRRHLSFGMGIHYCLGAALAQREGQVAFRVLLERMPGLALEDAPLQWGEGIVFHGLTHLPLRL